MGQYEAQAIGYIVAGLVAMYAIYRIGQVFLTLGYAP